MTEPDYLERLSSDWVNYFSAENQGQSTLYNPFRVFDIFATFAPDEFVELITMTCKLKQSRNSLEMLALGPIQDFLLLHISNYIDVIEFASADNSYLRWALQRISKGDIPDEFWNRIVKARGPINYGEPLSPE